LPWLGPRGNPAIPRPRPLIYATLADWAGARLLRSPPAAATSTPPVSSQIVLQAFNANAPRGVPGRSVRVPALPTLSGVPSRAVRPAIAAVSSHKRNAPTRRPGRSLPTAAVIVDDRARV